MVDRGGSSALRAASVTLCAPSGKIHAQWQQGFMKFHVFHGFKWQLGDAEKGNCICGMIPVIKGKNWGLSPKLSLL